MTWQGHGSSGFQRGRTEFLSRAPESEQSAPTDGLSLLSLTSTSSTSYRVNHAAQQESTSANPTEVTRVETPNETYLRQVNERAISEAFQLRMELQGEKQRADRLQMELHQANALCQDLMRRLEISDKRERGPPSKGERIRRKTEVRADKVGCLGARGCQSSGNQRRAFGESHPAGGVGKNEGGQKQNAGTKEYLPRPATV